MILSHTHPDPAAPARPCADQRAADLSRLGMVLTLKLAVALAIMLLAQAGDAFAPVATANPDWHGNAATAR